MKIRFRCTYHIVNRTTRLDGLSDDEDHQYIFAPQHFNIDGINDVIVKSGSSIDSFEIGKEYSIEITREL